MGNITSINLIPQICSSGSKIVLMVFFLGMIAKLHIVYAKSDTVKLPVQNLRFGNFNNIHLFSQVYTKTFIEFRTSALDDKINAFQEENPLIHVRDIKFTFNGASLAAMILYEY